MPPDENGGADNSDEIKSLIEKAVAEATKGLINNRDQLKDEKTKLQSKLDEMSSQWEGLDPKQVQSLMSRMQNDEETKLIAEGKIDEVLSRRTEALQGDYQKRIDAADQIRADLESKLSGMQGEVKKLVLDSTIRRSASDIGIIPTAIDDALYRAKDIFSIGENNSVVAKDADGSVKLGKDGKSPLNPAEWIESMKEQAPHWFMQNQGGGANGGSGKGGASSFSITRAQARNPQAYREAKAQAEQSGNVLRITED